jgi:predicted nucleic acid-binding protein
MVLLDTSIWVEFFRHKGSAEIKLAVRGLIEEFEAYLCGPTEMEFLGGVLPKEREQVQAWLNILPYIRNDQHIWRKAASTFSLLRQHGLTVPWNDALIATIALGQGCRIYAADKHFTAMAPLLGLRLYEPGYGGKFTPETE